MDKLHSLLNSYNMTSIIDNPRSLASVLSETRAFHETPLDAPKCVRLITELLYLLSQGSHLSTKEQDDLFFAFMKLFQSQNTRLRRMVYVLLKDISEGATSVFMVTNSLSKDMQSKNDSYRANAIRVSRILDAGTVAQIDRYLKAAVVDKSPFVASAALVCGVALAHSAPEMIRRWVNEVGEALNSRNPMVQYHALNLMYELKKQDRLSLQKLVCGFATGQQGGPVGTRSPQTECLLINFAVSMILSDRDPQIERVLLGYLDTCLKNKSEIVTFEAARSLCLLAQIETEHSGSRKLNSNNTTVMGSDFTHALTILQIGLGSSKPVNRIAALRTLNVLSRSRPLVVARCNQDIEPLLTDENRNIATLAFTLLLKTAQEANIDKLVRQIGSFMNDLTDMYKLDVVAAIRALCDSYPAKHKILLNFLAMALRDEGSHSVKHAIANAIISIVTAIPSSLDAGLLHLCEFIEDCEYPNLCCSIISFLTENIPRTQDPSKFIRFIYNRLILENATVRSAAVDSLTRISLNCPTLSANIRVLLETATFDSDDEVRDKVNLYLGMLTPTTRSDFSESDIRSIMTIDDNDFSIDGLYEALEQHMMDPAKIAKRFEVSSVPDERTYQAELRAREAAALAEAAAAAAAAAAAGSAATAAMSEAHKHASGGATSTAIESGAPKAEFLASVSTIIDPNVLGDVQHVCKPQSLTEAEAEYTVQVIKHIFGEFTVFEFYVRNTIEGVVLANVHVKLANVDPAVWKEIGSTPIPSLGFAEGKSAFTVLARRKQVSTASFPASLHFMQREDGDPVGFPDDFPIEPVKVGMGDYISGRQLPTGQFLRAWDTIGGNGIERVQKYALSYRTLEATVSGLINTLSMAPCEGTDRLEPGVQKPTLFLAGNFVGSVPVLAQAILYIHPQRGCMIQLTSRGGTEEAADAVQRALEL